MKGSREVAVGLVIAVVVAVCLIGLNIWIANAIDINKATSGLPGTGDQGSIPQDTSIQDPITITDIPKIVSSGSSRQPSEVACMISNDIFNDYKNNGDSSRAICVDNKCLVAISNFTLETASPGPNGGTDWENALYNSAEYGHCHLCRQPPSAGGAVIPTLDEVCVNLNLKDKTVVTSKFCGPWGDPSGNGLTYFSNSQCFSDKTVSSWANHCTDSSTNNNNFCYYHPSDNNKNRDKIIWIGDNDAAANGPDGCKGQCTNSPTKISDYSPYKMNEISLETGYEYLYGLIWDNVNRQYELHFKRIPNGMKVVSGNGWVDDVVNDLKNYGRYDIIGSWYKEAREVEYIDVKNSDETFGELYRKLGSDINEISNYCSSEDDCRSSEPENTGRILIKIGGVTSDNIFKHNGRLNSLAEYRISVKNWVYFPCTFSKTCSDKAFDRSISIWQCPDGGC